MKTVLLKSTLLTLGTVVASVVLAATIVPLLGGVVDGNAWLMCVLCPVLTAWPASSYTFWQGEKLKAAHVALAEAHSRLSAANAELERKSQRDPMTGLLNRETFYRVLQQSKGATNRGVLLIVDADNFKRLNDTHGHLAGDEALLAICAALSCAARPQDAVARIGGEEFAIFIAEAERGEAATIAEAVRAAVERIAFVVSGTRVGLSVSIGGARCAPDAEVTDIMRLADRRLYEAKSHGRNRVVLDAALPAAA